MGFSGGSPGGLWGSGIGGLGHPGAGCTVLR